jgi:hypothetical protein
VSAPITRILRTFEGAYTDTEWIRIAAIVRPDGAALHVRSWSRHNEEWIAASSHGTTIGLAEFALFWPLAAASLLQALVDGVTTPGGCE